MPLIPRHSNSQSLLTTGVHHPNMATWLRIDLGADSALDEDFSEIS